MLAQKQPHIQRVRNSSLVERSCATGAKHDTEAQGCASIGRGALPERGSHTERSGGVLGRENAGMSSESMVRIHTAEYPRYPG